MTVSYTHLDVYKRQDVERGAFEEIKRKFSEMIMMNHPDFEKVFYLQTDASNVAVGAELYQEDEEKEHLTIAFPSRSLQPAEKNYTTTEKELLSIVFAVGKFRTYILGNRTIIRTDHKALSFLNTCKLANSRLTRWVLVLQEYNFEWEYIRGTENKVPDTLSRVDSEDNRTGRDIKEIEIFKITREDKIFGEELKDISTMQRADGKSGKIINSLETELEESEYNQFFQIYKGLLFKRVVGGEHDWKLVIPEELEEKIIWDCHIRYGHFGAKKCVSVCLLYTSRCV